MGEKFGKKTPSKPKKPNLEHSAGFNLKGAMFRYKFVDMQIYNMDWTTNVPNK